MIDFHLPTRTGDEAKYILKAISNGKLNGGRYFADLCTGWMEEKFSAQKVLLTSSGTSALEMAAYLCEIQPGDEVIMPSFTFSSTASAFARLGAKIVFVDICADTMNCDVRAIREAISPRTKAICVVHYAGVSCEMDEILELSRRKGILVVEDAAHGVMGQYKGKALGTIGDLGCYSFHDTKNYSMGEGGALVINDKRFIERAEIILEKGTNRTQYIHGKVDKYTWLDIGGSYVPSELNAAFLWPQLMKANEINDNRLNSWMLYHRLLEPLAARGDIVLPFVPTYCKHNAHIFYIKTTDKYVRSRLMQYLKERDIHTAFHYVPLHNSPAGCKYGCFHGYDRFTSSESDKLLRLPIYYGLDSMDIYYIVESITQFYQK